MPKVVFKPLSLSLLFFYVYFQPDEVQTNIIESVCCCFYLYDKDKNLKLILLLILW